MRVIKAYKQVKRSEPEEQTTGAEFEQIRQSAVKTLAGKLCCKTQRMNYLSQAGKIRPRIFGVPQMSVSNAAEH